MTTTPLSLSALARLGFADLGEASRCLGVLASVIDVDRVIEVFSACADPDLALGQLALLAERDSAAVAATLADDDAARRLLRVLGASRGLGEFLARHPATLDAFTTPLDTALSPDEYRDDLLAAVGSAGGVAAVGGDDGARELRVRYRYHLARLAAWDLDASDPLEVMPRVAASLADLAGAALDGALAIARADSVFPAADVARTRLAIIGMGKAGARELNYVSDVDVIFVAEASGDLAGDRAIEIATSLAKATMRIVYEFGREPGLWEVDPNLRPEGKSGALVRTLDSHFAYYDRWAKGWEFQALLKARPLAGDIELGVEYCAGIAPRVWTSASRENFVGSVQRMRERVTAHIPADELPFQLKLGPGGIRDIEFTIQLLQLVHGQTDESVRQADTLGALESLAGAGYIGRAEAAEFSRHYRFLRVLEHRLQLSKLQRTHLMPSSEEGRRVLARASGLAAGSVELESAWSTTRREVRSLHERLFYRPLLSAVAALPGDSVSLTSDQAAARLAAIGFIDPRGALGHIQALTAGVSRRSAIQRHLLPVMLQWFADGADPDYGLLAFRRLSDDLGESHWFLRMLRDSSGAAQRLTHVLSSARYIGVLLERIPEAAAWFDDDDDLIPRSLETLLEEARATVKRHDDPDAAALALRTARRREVLRLAIAAIVGLIDVQQLGRALTDIATALLTGVLALVHPVDGGIEFGIIAMGRYGGGELGFGSDVDVVYVYRQGSADGDLAQRTAERIVSRVAALTEDLRLPFDLDIGLRPEGKSGAVVRSIESYRAYYERWSLTWEAQALLRARAVVGDPALLLDFEKLADEVRFPANIDEAAVREVKRIKARVESERLPQGADPSRHLKLGRGSLSDVEWFVQLIQLQHGAQVAGLRTTSTLDALSAATENGFVTAAESELLRAAWIFASRARSSMTLWMVRTTDVLPVDRPQLEGIARIMAYPPGSASVLEDDYLRVTRRARRVFEKRFFGVDSISDLPSG